MSDLDVVAKELDDVSTKWYPLGKALLGKIHHNHVYLDSIRTEYPHDEKLCLREMLTYWLKNYIHYTLWSDLAAGLRTTGDSQLADYLEEKYCFSELTTTCTAIED